MNDFQTSDSGKGLLKSYYGESSASGDTLGDKLKKRREKMFSTFVEKGED
jgi:hypothetical protein